MRSNNFTLRLVVFPLKSILHFHKSFHLHQLLTGFLLFISFLSLAGERKENKVALSVNSNCSAGWKVPTSPFTEMESIRSNLYLVNDNNTTILADGVLTEYNSLYNDSVCLEDAYKFTNITENLGINRYGAVLSIERRPVITNTDTLFFKLWKTTRRNYQLEFVTVNLEHPGMQAFLEDSYLVTSTLIALSGTTKINFSVNASAASSNVNRFRIIYKTTLSSAPLPVNFTSVEGNQVNNRISIGWKVENEINIEKYEVERSGNGTDFIKVNSIRVGSQMGASNSYSWIDANPLCGINFYRIKSVDRDGSKKYSTIVKVTACNSRSGSVLIYPNPIKGNRINLRFINQPIGIYRLRLTNNYGQIIYSDKVMISSGDISQSLFTGKKLAGGIYQLEIITPDNRLQVKKAVVQE